MLGEAAVARVVVDDRAHQPLDRVETLGQEVPAQGLSVYVVVGSLEQHADVAEHDADAAQYFHADDLVVIAETGREDLLEGEADALVVELEGRVPKHVESQQCVHDRHAHADGAGLGLRRFRHQVIRQLLDDCRDARAGREAIVCCLSAVLEDGVRVSIQHAARDDLEHDLDPVTLIDHVGPQIAKVPGEQFFELALVERGPGFSLELLAQDVAAQRAATDPDHRADLQLLLLGGPVIAEEALCRDHLCVEVVDGCLEVLVRPRFMGSVELAE